MVFASGARSQLSAARRDARRSCRRSRRCQTHGICCALPYTCRWAASARRSRGTGVKEGGEAAAPSGRNLADKQGRRNLKMKKNFIKKEDGARGAAATLVRSWGTAGCSGRGLSGSWAWGGRTCPSLDRDSRLHRDPCLPVHSLGPAALPRPRQPQQKVLGSCWAILNFSGENPK